MLALLLASVLASSGLSDGKIVTQQPFGGIVLHDGENPEAALVLWCPFTTPGSYPSGSTALCGTSAPWTGQALTLTRSSAATFDVSGVLSTTTTDRLRVESRGALIEQASTNWAPYSIPTTTAGDWIVAEVTGGGGTVEWNAATAPDGTQTAAVVTLPSGTWARLLQQGVSIADPSVCSVWAKNVSGTNPSVAVHYSYGCTDDLDTVSGTDVLMSTSWTRYSVSRKNRNPNYSRGCRCGVNCYSVGSECVFHVWGMQMEQGESPTSTIYTSGTSASRSADEASVASPLTSNPTKYAFDATIQLFDPAGLWTGGLAQTIREATPNPVRRHFASAGTDGAANAWAGYVTATTPLVAVNDNQTTGTWDPLGLLTTGSAHRFTFGAVGGLFLETDGVARTLNSGAGSPGSASQPATLRIGSGSAGEEANACLKNVRVFTKSSRGITAP
jgi:hypothetical protein